MGPNLCLWNVGAFDFFPGWNARLWPFIKWNYWKVLLLDGIHTDDYAICKNVIM